MNRNSLEVIHLFFITLSNNQKTPFVKKKGIDVEKQFLIVQLIEKYFAIILLYVLADAPKKSRSFADDVMKLFRSEFVEKVM